MLPQQLTQEGQRTEQRAWDPSVSPLWFSEANVGSVAVIIQSFFSICLLFDILVEHMPLVTLFTAVSVVAAHNVSTFAALFAGLHGFQQRF